MPGWSPGWAVCLLFVIAGYSFLMLCCKVDDIVSMILYIFLLLLFPIGYFLIVIFVFTFKESKHRI